MPTTLFACIFDNRLQLNIIVIFLILGSSERSVSPTDSEGEPRRKKARTSFTNEQIQLLERIYTSQRYLASHNRTDIARMLNLSETQVIVVTLTNIVKNIVSCVANRKDVLEISS